VATQGIGVPVLTNAVSTTVADMDGNGQLDVVVAFLNSNSVVILHRVGNGVTPTVITQAMGGFNQPSFIAVADVNGV